LTERIRPERQRKKPDGEYVLRKPLPERWWQYGEKRPALRKAIAELPEALVIALVSKTVMPVRVPRAQIFSHKLGVFATDSYADQAVLSSVVHQLWVVKYASTMRADINYSPSDVFETFPRPAAIQGAEGAGRTLDDERRHIMLRRGIGLTRLYNMVNDANLSSAEDSDVARIRVLHTELDRTVVDAYGWTGIDLDHGFHTFRQVQRWTVGPAARADILDRLLEENHRRAKQQRGRAVQDTGRPDRAAADGLFFI
jgi:hypothetical protein